MTDSSRSHGKLSTDGDYSKYGGHVGAGRGSQTKELIDITSAGYSKNCQNENILHVLHTRKFETPVFSSTLSAAVVGG